MDEEIKSADQRRLDESHQPNYEQDIVAVMRSNLTPKALKERLSDFHENDIAGSLELLDANERSKLYNVLKSSELSDVLEYTDDLGKYFGEINIRKKIEILSNLEADTAVEYLKTLSKAERTTLIDLMGDDAKREIALIGSFDEDEIGSRMTTNYIDIDDINMSVRDAMKALVEQASENDNISTIYVTDKDRTFYGAIDLKDLIIARQGTSLESIVMTSYPYVYASETIDDCIERIKDYSEDSIPVLDSKNMLLGVLTSQTIVDITDEEMGEDYAMLAGLVAEEDLNEPVKKSLTKRLPWLTILLFLGMLVSSAVGMFDKVIQQLTLLVSFQSLVLDMAGNVGTQSLAVTIRVLTDDRVSAKQKKSLIFKEVRVGACNGLIVGLASLIVVGLYLMLAKRQPSSLAFAISACTGTALFISMTLSSLSGTCIPLIFKKIKIDPAVASGPLITTLNDFFGVVSYYGLAWLFLINTVHI